jgi:hypothetical protein
MEKTGRNLDQAVWTELEGILAREETKHGERP